MKTRLFLFCYLLATTSFSQSPILWMELNSKTIYSNKISTIENWRTIRKTNSRVVASIINIDYSNKRIYQESYFNYLDKPSLRINEEKWSADSLLFLFNDYTVDSLKIEHLVEKKTDTYNSNKQLIKHVVETMPGPYFKYTAYIDPLHLDFHNSVLIKVRLPTDTFQYIVNKQNINQHEYYIKEKINNEWIITEKSITGFKNGKFYSYENYKNGKLLNKYTIDDQKILEKNNDEELMVDDVFGLPHLEHGPPTDTTYSVDLTFNKPNKITSRRESTSQFKRIRIYMNEKSKELIEEWIYNGNGLLVKKNILYADYSEEFIYK